MDKTWTQIKKELEDFEEMMRLIKQYPIITTKPIPYQPYETG